jgi:phage/plasmid-like protein (TIGR03299 family)
VSINLPPWVINSTELPERVSQGSVAVQRADLDWEVALDPVLREKRTKTADGESIIVETPGEFHVVRLDTDQAIKVVGDKYVPIQNRDAFRVFDEAFIKHDITYDYMGLYKEGAKIWALARLPETMKIHVTGKNVDEVQQHMLLVTSHDGSMSMRVVIAPIRTACFNTLSLPLTESMAVSIKHTKNSPARLEEAINIVKAIKSNYEELAKYFQKLAETPFSQEDFNIFVKAILPSQEDIDEETGNKTFKKPGPRLVKMRRQLHDVYMTDDTIVEWRGTAWGAYNAFTAWVDHHRQYRTNDTKIQQIWLGNGATHKAQALSLVFAKATGLSLTGADNSKKIAKHLMTEGRKQMRLISILNRDRRRIYK